MVHYIQFKGSQVTILILANSYYKYISERQAVNTGKKMFKDARKSCSPIGKNSHEYFICISR